MSEESKEPRKSGWLKALFGTLAGLMSGALMMYISPLVDKVIKPAKPVANFAVEHSGLTVTFHNRSNGGGQGRWDFGDGTPLEFVPASQATVTHTYSRPGTYSAKLVVTNLLGEENERSVTIDLTDDSRPKTVERPAIVDLYVRAPGKVGEPVFAPATFQFKATADNAMHYVWDFGDGKGPHLSNGDLISHTFDTPGTYNIKLCAFNGRERSIEETTVNVMPPTSGMLTVSMRVVDAGMQKETRRRETPVSQTWQINPKKGPSTVEATVAAASGYEIVAVEKKRSNNGNLEKVDVKIAADKRSVKLVGQVKKASFPVTAVLNEHLVITEQKKSKAAPMDRMPVAGAMQAPGTATLRMPPTPDDWCDVCRSMVFELKQGDRLIWKGDDLPTNVPVTVNGAAYLLTGTAAGEKVQLTLSTGRIASK